MKLPRLSTFASTENHVKTALSAGADHLILEEPNTSIRVYCDDSSRYIPDIIMKNAALARSLNPTTTFSINCDLLYHDRHFQNILTLIETAKKSGISMFRIQDPGLILFIKKHYPEASFHLAMETANFTLSSLKFYANIVDFQTLNNELPYPELIPICRNAPSKLEIQVLGPLLIQYANRRYLAGRQGLNENDPKSIVRTAEDQDYKHRHYKFLDTTHGHFMYLYFDRFLLKYLPQLMKLNIDSWLIDARGESDEYLHLGLKLFKSQAKTYQENPAAWTYNEINHIQLTNAAARPLRPGFFRANNTDQERRKFDILKDAFQFGDEVAKIKDYKKGSWVIIEASKELKTNTPYWCVSPEEKATKMSFDAFYTLSGEKCPTAPPFTLIKLKWQKGHLPYSKLFEVKNT